MKTVVQKYGGTSVNSKQNRSKIIFNAKDAIAEGLSPVIVVSAMGRYPAPYSTDGLLSLIDDQVTINPRSRDLLSSIGEIISTVVVSEALCSSGLKAVPLTGGQAGILTDDRFGEGNIVKIDTKRLLSLCGQGIIPVVAGFQGVNTDGDILTLGRGGSDITATALGAALESELVEIYTDVDGVMTADPNIVENAELINRIEYDDVFRLAEYGAKVIHPRAVSYAMRASVPVAILNVASERGGQHTIISDATDLPRGETTFSAVTSKDKCLQVEVTDKRTDQKIFTALAENGISIDMINIFSDRKIFITQSDVKSRLVQIFEKLELDYKVSDGFSKITVLGNYIVGVPGIVAKIVAALYSNEINVYQSSDSSTTISVLIRSEDSHKALKILHDVLVREKEA
jgi:aspartate kinase